MPWHCDKNKIEGDEELHAMPHGDPIILTLSVCKGKGVVVHLSLLFTALLHSSLFGGSIHVSTSYACDGIPTIR